MCNVGCTYEYRCFSNIRYRRSRCRQEDCSYRYGSWVRIGPCPV